MTVRELIAALEVLPNQNAEVFYSEPGDDGRDMPIRTVQDGAPCEAYLLTT